MAARKECTTERTENTEKRTFALLCELCGLCGEALFGLRQQVGVGRVVISERVGSMSLREQLVNAMQGNVVVMGIGNPCRGDDAAGSCVAQRICGAPGVRVIDAEDVPENYLRQIVHCRPDTVVLIDAVDLNSPAGSVALLDKNQTTGYWPSTHRVPMSLVVDYLERETHARMFLVGIQPLQTAFLQPMSAQVAASIEGIAEVLTEVLETRKTP